MSAINFIRRVGHFHGAKAPVSRKERVMVIGSGQLAIPPVIEAIGAGKSVAMFAKNPKRLQNICSSLRIPASQVSFHPTSYSDGLDPEFWQKAIDSQSDDISDLRIVNLRGIAPLGNSGITYEDVFARPLVALANGLQKRANKALKIAVVNASSSAASIPGFAEVNAYAKARKHTDEEFQSRMRELGIPGRNLRFDLVISSTQADTMVNPNHGASFLNLSKSMFQFVVGSSNLLALQPISEKHAARAILSDKVFEDGPFTTVDAVGPKGYSQIELYQYYSDILNKQVRIVEIPFDVADWISKHVELAQLSYGVPLLKHRATYEAANQELDCSQFEALVGEPLLELPEIYDSLGDGEFLQVTSPTQQIAKAALAKLSTSAEARREFREKMLPYMPQLVGSAARSVFFQD